MSTTKRGLSGATLYSYGDLLLRVHQLEEQLVQAGLAPAPRIQGGSAASLEGKPNRPFRFSAYPSRKIALRLAYSGWQHCGLAWQPDITPLETVEAELFKALLRARLVDLKPEDSGSRPPLEEALKVQTWRQRVDLEAWGYSRAGRTDAGVSSSGQVVALWVRSNLTRQSDREAEVTQRLAPQGSFRAPENESLQQSPAVSSNPAYEFSYVSMLNSLLPESIRILDWSAVAPDFDARFSCCGRHYKYLFAASEGGNLLDIQRMRVAAQTLVGEHDFRNLCKLDKAKQISNFKRAVYSATIEPVAGEDDMHVLNLFGSAFLYNQVRNIVSILFLIGSGLEDVDLFQKLTHTDATSGLAVSGSTEAYVETKPEFSLANPLPLLLWECHYPAGSFKWRNSASEPQVPGGNAADLHSTWLRHRFKAAVLRHHFYSAVTESNAAIGDEPSNEKRHFILEVMGAGEFRARRSYIPILERRRQTHYMEANANWLAGKGARRVEKRAKMQKKVEQSATGTTHLGEKDRHTGQPALL